MKVKLNKGRVVIEGEKAKVIITDDLNNISDDINIVISTDRSAKDLPGKYLINNPGEYEVQDVFVYAIAKDNEKIELFSIDIEGVNFVYIASNSELPSKKVLDQLSLNNVLLIKIVDKKVEISEIINEFDPESIVPIVESQEDLLSLAKALSVPLPEAQSGLTLNVNNFNAEEEHSYSLVVLK